MDVLDATLDAEVALEGYEFVPSCEEIAVAEPTCRLVFPASGTRQAKAQLAVCDGGRQLAIAKWSLPATHAEARTCAGWTQRQRALAAAHVCNGSTAVLDEGMSQLLAQLRAASRVLVLLNGHCYSAWHARKRLLLQQEEARRGEGADAAEDAHERALRGELALSTLVLARFPSAPDAWAHRRWLLTEATQRTAPHPRGTTPPVRVEPRLPEALLVRELVRCDAATAAKRANYYAGVQRAWLHARLPTADGPGAGAGGAALPAALRAELGRTERLLRSHTTDSSARFQRQSCVLAAIFPPSPASRPVAVQWQLARAELELAQALARAREADAAREGRGRAAGGDGGRAWGVAARDEAEDGGVARAHHRFAIALCMRLGVPAAHMHACAAEWMQPARLCSAEAGAGPQTRASAPGPMPLPLSALAARALCEQERRSIPPPAATHGSSSLASLTSN